MREYPITDTKYKFFTSFTVEIKQHLRRKLFTFFKFYFYFSYLLFYMKNNSFNFIFRNYIFVVFGYIKIEIHTSSLLVITI